MKKINLPALIASIAIAEATGFLSALVSGNFRGGYEDFAKPPLSPPAIVFPIVWTLLYAAMGAAAYLVYDSARSTSAAKRSAVRLYVAQLIVNFSWSIFFFGLGAFWFSVGVILLLLALVLLTTIRFRDINRLSYWLMLPYLLWLVVATYLNVGVAILN